MENKDLDLPAMEVMVATFLCEQIVKETLGRLTSDETWLALRKDVEARPVPEFRKNITSILENTLSQYDMEAIHFKESIRDDKRKELETKALKVLHPAYAAMLRHLRSSTLECFKTGLMESASSDGFEASIDSNVQEAKDKFEKESRDISISEEWDASAARENLFSEIEKTEYITKTKYNEVYNTMKAKVVRVSAQVIGGMAGAGVATVKFIREWDAVVAKVAGDAASTAVRKMIENASETFDNLEGHNANDNVDDRERQ